MTKYINDNYEVNCEESPITILEDGNLSLILGLGLTNDLKNMGLTLIDKGNNFVYWEYGYNPNETLKDIYKLEYKNFPEEKKSKLILSNRKGETDIIEHNDFFKVAIGVDRITGEIMYSERKSDNRLILFGGEKLRIFREVRVLEGSFSTYESELVWERFNNETIYPDFKDEVDIQGGEIESIDFDDITKTINLRFKIFGKRIGFKFEVPDPIKVVNELNDIKNVLQNNINKLSDLEKIFNGISNLPDDLKRKILEEVVNPALNELRETINQVKKELEGAIDEVSGVLFSIEEGVVSGVNIVGEAFEDLGDDIIQPLDQFYKDINKEIMNITNKTTDFIEDVGGELKTIGENIGEVAIDFGEGAEDFIDILMKFAEFIFDILGEIFKIMKYIPRLAGSVMKFYSVIQKIINILVLLSPVIIIFLVSATYLDYLKHQARKK